MSYSQSCRQTNENPKKCLKMFPAVTLIRRHYFVRQHSWIIIKFFRNFKEKNALKGISPKKAVLFLSPNDDNIFFRCFPIKNNHVPIE